MHKVIFQLKYERGNGEVEERKIAGGRNYTMINWQLIIHNSRWNWYSTM